MKKITIAVDGYVGTGKGTTALGVAKTLGYQYLDTGSMYRAVTLYAQRKGLLDASDEAKAAIMRDISLSYEYNQETDHHDMIMNGENVEKDIRQTSLAVHIPQLAGVQKIRDVLVEKQYTLGKEGGIVADGRDMGTVVFPTAELKVFLVCELDIRVERRHLQLVGQGYAADKSAIREEIIHRDTADYLGENAINHKANDAIEIDTGKLTIDEQISSIVALANERIAALE